MGRRGRAITSLWVACAAISVTTACQSFPPVRAIRAARYYAQGTRALDRGEASEAIRSLERAADLMPTASEIRNHLGLAYWSDDRRRDALRELEQAVRLDCDNEEARANLARLRAESGSGSHGG